MSENPYAPPSSDLGSETAAGAFEGRGDFDIGQCLSDAWSNTWANFPLWLIAGTVFLIASAASLATVIGILVLFPVLLWGATLFALRMHDGGAEFGDIFAGFSDYVTALLGMLAVLLVLVMVGLAGQSIQTAGDATDNTILLLIGLPINLVVSLYVSPRLTFAYLYVVDQQMPPMEALGQAWRDTAPVRWKVVAMMLLGLLILAAGLAAFLVGVVPAVVIVTLMWVSAYRQLVGRTA